MNRLDEPVFMAGPKPLLTEFGIHHRLESCKWHTGPEISMVLQAVKLMFNLCLMSAVECYVSFFNTVPSTKTPSSFSHNNAPNPFLPLRDSSHLMVAKRREN